MLRLNRIWTLVFISIACASTAYTPWIYARMVPPRTWCHIPYWDNHIELIRESSILFSVLAMSYLFLHTTISSLKRSSNIYVNIAIFICSYTLIVSVFSVYFYAFGLQLKTDVKINPLIEDIPMAKNMSDYVYFSLSNSIYMETPEFEPCHTLRAGIVLQRISSLLVAFGAGLVGSRINKTING